MKRWPWIVAGGLCAAAGAGLAGFAALTARRVERALPPRGRFLQTSGGRLHWLEAGAGPPVVLIHGLGGQAGNFTHSLVEQLSGDFRVFVVERPGAGHSTRARGAGAGVRAQARAFADFIEAQRLGRPLVVGHSLGGAIALALALDHPERVGGLALVAPLTQAQASPPPVFRALAVRSPWLRHLLAWTLATPLAMARGRATVRQVFAPERVPADYATRGGGLLSLRPRSFISASTDLMAASDDLEHLRARHGDLRIPVGVLFGREDQVLDAEENGAALRDLIPGAHVEIVSGGHMLPVTQSLATAVTIRRVAERMRKDNVPV